MFVYVLDINSRPLMPTKRCGKVRRMLMDGKAKVVRREPFTIKLLYSRRSTLCIVDKFYYDEDGTSHSLQTIEELYDFLTHANYKLCYVEEFGYDYATLYYASTDAENVWGDDWDDIPYEHNAGEPYDDRSDYDIVKVTIKGCFKTPSYGHLNSPYSVEIINNGDAPWIEFTDYEENNEELFANSTIKDLLKLEEKRSDVLQIIDF